MASGFSSEEAVRVVKEFFIGDIEDAMEGGARSVEVFKDENDYGGEKATIIIDPGADAPIFPATWCVAGRKVVEKKSKCNLQDALGNSIPTLGRRDVEIVVKDGQGRNIRIKEPVTLNEAVSQPILCFVKTRVTARR